jgi:hypothetical protein
MSRGVTKVEIAGGRDKGRDSWLLRWFVVTDPRINPHRLQDNVVDHPLNSFVTHLWRFAPESRSSRKLSRSARKAGDWAFAQIVM